jgi:O-antigen/teichoic acid export membrane protein
MTASHSTEDQLGLRTMRGLRWSYFSIGVNALVQIGFAAAMARLLTPAAFGVVAMAGVVLRYGMQMSQLGLGEAIVQRPALSREDVRAAFTSSLALGAVFMAVFWFFAPVAGAFFHDPDVVGVTRGLSVGFVIAGLSTTPLSLLRRDLSFRPIAIIEIVAYVVGYGAFGVGLAAAGAGFWALVAGALAQQAIGAVLFLLVRRFDARPYFAWARVRHLYSFGGKVTAISLLEVTLGTLGTFWIGATMSAGAVGLYNRASYLISLPSQYITTGLSRVLLPSFSSVQADTARLRGAYLAAVTAAAAVILPLGWGVAGAASQVVGVVLGPQWTEAAPVLAILALAAPFSMLSHFAGILCEATATLWSKLGLTAGRLALLVVMYWALAPRGLTGLAVALLVEEVVTQGLYLVLVRRVLQTSYLPVLSVFRVGLPSGIAALLVTWGAAAAGRWAGAPEWVVFIVQLALGVLVLAGFAWFGGGGVVREELRRRWRQLRAPGGEPDAVTGSGGPA